MCFHCIILKILEGRGNGRKKTFIIRTGMSIQNYRQRLEKIRKLNLTSDLFSSVVFQDLAAIQDVLRIMTGIENIKVIRTEPQRSYRNLHGHSSVLDVWAEDDVGTQYNLEIQIAEDEDHLRRSRFIQSRMDSRCLDSGEPYEKLPELYLIFITKKDFLQLGRSVTEILRITKDTNQYIDNGIHEIYANLDHPEGDDKITRLLQYIRDTNNPDISTEGFENLAKRVNYLKNDEEGGKYMCEFSDWLTEEGRTQGLAEGKMLSLIHLVLKKQERGVEAAEIADLLEEDISTIDKILLAVLRAKERTPEAVFACM